MKKSVGLILLLLFVLQAWAQNPCSLKVSGRLLHAADSTSISAAEVFVEEPHVKTKTDPDGYFLLKKLCPGSILLEIDLGEGIHIHHFIETQNDTQLLIYLHENIISLKQAEVLRKKSQTATLNREDLQNRAGYSISNQLGELPGIQTLRSGQTLGKPIAEGMTGLRLPVYVNGIRLESQQWGNDHTPEIDGMGYDRIRRITGAATLTKTHDALAGIIEINSFPDAHYGELDMTTGTAFATNGRQFTAFAKASGRPAGQRYSWHSNATFRRSGNYRTPSYYLQNTGQLEIAFNAGLEKENTKGRQLFTMSAYHLNAGIFQGSRAGSISDLLAAINRTEPLYGKGVFSYAIGAPRQNTSHFQGGYENKKPNSHYIISAQFNNRREFDYHRSSTNSFPQLDLYMGQVTAAFNFNTAYLRHKHIRWGFSSGQWINRYAGYFFIPDMVANSTGAYVLFQKQAKQWLYEGSLRGDIKYLLASWESAGQNFRKERLFGYISAGFTMQRNWSKQQISIHFLKLWRAPWINELYSKGVHHASASFEKGNPNLSTEQDYKSSVEHIFYFKKLQVHSNAYANFIRHFINLTPSAEPVQTIRGAFPAYEYDQRDALFTGTDITASYQTPFNIKLHGQFSYTYGVYLKDKQFPAYIPLTWYSGGLTYRKKNFYIKAEMKHFFQQEYYSPGTDFLPPPTAYSLLNVLFSARNMGRGQHISFNIEAGNLLNTKYRDYLDRFRYYSDLQGRNIQFRFFYNFHHHNINH